MKNTTIQKIEESQEELRIIRERREGVLDTLHKLSEIIETESLIKSLSIDIKTAEDICEASTRQYGELVPQIESGEQEKKELATELDSHQTELAPLEQEVRELKTRVISYEEKCSAISSMKEQVSLIEYENRKSVAEIKRIEEEIRLISKETPGREEKLKNDVEVEKKLNDDVSELTIRLEEIAREVSDPDRIREMTEAIPVWTEEIEVNSEKITQLNASMEFGTKLKTELSDELERSNEERDQVSGHVDELSHEAEELRQIVISKDEEDTLREKLDVSVQERDDTRERIARFEREIEEHLESKGDIINTIEQSESELESVTLEWNQLKEKVEPYQKDPHKLDILKNRISALDREIEGHEKNSESAREELSHLNKALYIIKSECSGYKEAMDQISSLLS